MTSNVNPSFLFLALFWASSQLPDDGEVVPSSFTKAASSSPYLVEGSLHFDRGTEPGIWVPPGEQLKFKVHVDLGVLGQASAGAVTMSSGVEPFVSSLPLPGKSRETSEDMAGWVQIRAQGKHLGYELDHTMTTRFLPQDWPRVLSSEVQKGSENRQRELKLGPGTDEWNLSYRSDSHCHSCTRREHFVEASLPWNKDYHCKRCKRGEHRLWGSSRERSVPTQAIDILGAVYLARSLVRDGADELALCMVQKDRLWDVTLKQGRLEDIQVSGGHVRCREVRLSVSRPEGEPSDGGKFSGLFGIKGDLKIWFHETTGVPVLIEGDVPIGDIIDLHATIRLEGFEGTPEAFGFVE